MANSQNHCQFYLTKKKRYCRFTPKANATYCPEHSCVMGIQEDRKRIPCPLNPKHNCYEDDLKNHLKKCNVTKKRQAVEKLPYFERDINKGTQEDCKDDPKFIKESVRNLTSTRLAEMIEKVNRLHSENVKYIEKLYLEHTKIKEKIVGTSATTDLSKAFGDQAMLRKEMLQQASLVGQLENLGFLSKGNCFVELGAGKGKLSHWIQKASDDSVDNSFLLVERGSVRYKVDSFHKHKEKEGTFERIKIDIQDLYLGNVPSLQCKESIVVVGKHLCGGATDLGIRCAMNTLNPICKSVDLHQCIKKLDQSQSFSSSLETDLTKFTNKHGNLSSKHSEKGFKMGEVTARIESGSSLKCFDPDTSTGNEQSSKKNENDSNLCKGNDRSGAESIEPPEKIQRLHDEAPVNSKLQGVMIALCCHHQCTWNTYVGRELMRKLGINEEEFDILTRLSSWATCARTRLKGKTATHKSTVNEMVDASKKSNLDDESAEMSGYEDGKLDEKEDHSVEDLIGSGLDEDVPLREKLSVSEREVIGRKAKRIIDIGRIEYLRSKNMRCFLREYISDDITPENIVMIAISDR